jgi:ankyrin repeat protein
MGGFRLDRRRDALAGAVRPMIIPGSSVSSRLYRRIIGSEFGAQMPPTGALPAREVDTLTAWIDQGAEWPDALANDAPPPVPDPGALRMSEAIRAGDLAHVRTELRRDARVVNARGRAGTTPLMDAAAFGNGDLLRSMLEAGGDPNLRNDAGATALMWALDDAGKTRMLLERGADPNARSSHGRAPLLLAAGQIASAPVVRLLLERGATVPAGALAAAAGRGDLDVIRLLLQAGARDIADAATAALRAGCVSCLEALAAAAPLPPLRNALVGLLPPAGGRLDAVPLALRHGADVNARDAQGRTVLMKAVVADQLPADVVRTLLERGADVTVKTSDGATALDFARAGAGPEIVELLVKAGATAGPPETPRPTMFVTNNSRRAAVNLSLPLLQKTAGEFYRKSGCVSCHHNALTAMSVAAAAAAKFPVNARLRREELATVAADAFGGHDVLMQGLVPFGGGPPSVGYVLLGLAAERYRPDAATDAMVRLLRLSQLPDGHWVGANRPPSEASEFTYTTVNLRGIQQFQSPGCRDCAAAVTRAVEWLSRSQPVTTEDRVFRVLGLAWGHVAKPVLQAAVTDLLASQRSDGGWAQLTFLQSDAYATGSALFALRAAGQPVSGAPYRRGVEFLLRTQLPDGSWYVTKRAQTTQPYFESGFPHGVHQFISAAATNWATLALIAAE